MCLRRITMCLKLPGLSTWTKVVSQFTEGCGGVDQHNSLTSASSAESELFLHRTQNCSILAIKQLPSNHTSKTSEETDILKYYFTKSNNKKTCHFICDYNLSNAVTRMQQRSLHAKGAIKMWWKNCVNEEHLSTNTIKRSCICGKNDEHSKSLNRWHIFSHFPLPPQKKFAHTCSLLVFPHPVRFLYWQVN